MSYADKVLDQAEQLIADGKPDEAQALIAPLIEAEPNNPRAWSVLADATTDAAEAAGYRKKVVELARAATSNLSSPSTPLSGPMTSHPQQQPYQPPPPYQQSDQLLYDDGGMVRITQSQIIIAGVTYPVYGVTSVRVQLEKPRTGWLTFFMLLAAFVMIGGVFAASDNLFCLIVGALAFLTLAVVLYFETRKKRYELIIGTAGGERSALSSTNESALHQAYHAISQAISRR